MSIADLAETFIEINLMTPDQAHACRKLAWWLSNTTCGQLITLAEAQAMVAAERERCAVLMENRFGAAWGAKAIRAAATDTKEGM